MTDWNSLQSDFLAYRRGDNAATRRVFEPLLSALRSFFRMRTDVLQDAEDLAQVTILKIHLARDRYDGERSVKTWVFAIASRSLIDHWRGSQRESLQVPDNGQEEAPSADLPYDVRFQLNEALLAALSTLKPLDRTIVYLYGVEELSMAEIGATVGLTEAATKLRAHRAYVKLRAILEPQP